MTTPVNTMTTPATSNVLVLCKQLMLELRCRKDGVLADSMQDKEDQTLPAWGVAVMHVEDIVHPYIGNHDLAFELLHQSMREARLAASFLLDGSRLTIQDLEHILPYLLTTELIEQFSMRVFPKVPGAENFFIRILENGSKLPDKVGQRPQLVYRSPSLQRNQLLYRAALLSLGRIWKASDKLTLICVKEHLVLLLCESNAHLFAMENQLSFAVDALLTHFPLMVTELNLEMQNKIKKLTLLHYGSI